jgi:hypothetical protein
VEGFRVLTHFFAVRGEWKKLQRRQFAGGHVQPVFRERLKKLFPDLTGRAFGLFD